ncbi:hypothetical protein DFH27DRAFT_545628 [Peziza echinospora]|nr:hypothetical protein DFH27DRAFT_545628 [Peziza echinospora]
MQKPGILLSFVLAAFANQATAYNGFPELAYGYGSQALVAPGLHVAGSAVQPVRARGVMSRLKVRMILEGRQTTPTCETGYTYFPECAADGEGGCCSSQGQCCVMEGEDWCCDNTHTCYRSSTDGKASCCLKGAETCNAGLCVVAGSLCCPAPNIQGGKVFACAATAVCNTNQGANCCAKGSVLCPNACCPAGTTCPVGKPGTCNSASVTTSTTVSTTTSSSSSRITSSSSGGITSRSSTGSTGTPTGTNTPTASTATRGSGTGSLPTATGLAVACSIGTPLRSANLLGTNFAENLEALPANVEGSPLGKRQSGSSGYYCTLSGETLPVMQIEYEQGVSDELVSALCAGIKKRSKSGNEAVLTWADDEKIGLRRRRSGCIGLCKGKVTSSGDMASCNQFPFASTIEGGEGSSLTCISSYQNTIQGIYLNSWARLYNLRAGSKFIVRVSGYDCDAKVETKRQISAQAVDPPVDYSSSGSTEKLTAGLAAQVGSGINYAIVPIGDIDPGLYDVTLDFGVSSTSSINKVTVINSDGAECKNTNSKSPITDKVYSFEAADVDFGVAVVVETTFKTFKVSYKLAAKVQPVTTTPKSDGSGVKAPFMAGIAMAVGGVAAFVL